MIWNIVKSIHSFAQLHCNFPCVYIITCIIVFRYLPSWQMSFSYISNINIAIHIVYLKDLSTCNNARYCGANKTLDTLLIKKTKVCPS